MRPTFFLRRTTSTPSRSSLSPRLRTQRYKSTKSESEPVPKDKASSPSHAESHSTPSSPLPPSETSPSVPAPSGLRSLRQIIQAGPVGRLGRSYSRFQERRPYTTQVCSSIVIYLCGDLSAQFLFPEKPSSAQQKSLASGEKGQEHAVVEEGESMTRGGQCAI